MTAQQGVVTGMTRRQRHRHRQRHTEKETETERQKPRDEDRQTKTHTPSPHHSGKGMLKMTSSKGLSWDVMEHNRNSSQEMYLRSISSSAGVKSCADRHALVPIDLEVAKDVEQKV